MMPYEGLRGAPMPDVGQHVRVTLDGEVRGCNPSFAWFNLRVAGRVFSIHTNDPGVTVEVLPDVEPQARGFAVIDAHEDLWLRLGVPPTPWAHYATNGDVLWSSWVDLSRPVPLRRALACAERAHREPESDYTVIAEEGM